MSRRARVTIADVAARAGVAISSVSSALNGRPGVSEVTRARVIAVAEDMGFVPSAGARSLSGDRAFALGLIVHRDTEVMESDPFFAAFISGLERCMDPRGYALVLQIIPEEEPVADRYRRLAAARRVDGVFLDELTIDDERLALVQELELPAVAVNPDEDIPVPAVRQDCAPGIDAAVAHLSELGHREVAFVTGPSQFVHSRQREQAWRDACDRHGVRQGRLVDGGLTYEGGYGAADTMLAGQAPSAVLCVNDLSAMGLMARALERGWAVPDDLSVIGYDGLRMGALVRPSLTTVSTTPVEVGAHAAELLLDLVEGVPAGDRRIEPARFVPRESTAPFRHL